MPKPNWTAIVNALTPIFGQLASRGDNGGFMQGYQASQQRLDSARRQSEQEAQAKRKVGADYRLNMLDRLLRLDDPMAFETMKGAAGDAGAQAYGLEPDAFRDVQFSDEKRFEQLTKELSEQLEGLEKGGYDLFELSDSGAAMTLKDRTQVPIASAIEMTRRAPVAGGQAIRPPKKQPTATGTAAERAAAIRQQIEEAMETGDGALADRLQNRYRNLLETEREFGEASRKPSDPELGDMNKTLKELQIDAAKARLNPDPELAGMNKTLKELQIESARARLDKPADASHEALVQSVLDNPSIYDSLTPTIRSKIAGDLAKAGFAFGKPLAESAVGKMAETRAAVQSLKDLREILQKNERFIGPVAGLSALNPYSAARMAQADIDRVRQRVGKALEGGVLRKEDEEKYKRILATLRDTPETAIYKVDQLVQNLESDLKLFEDEQRRAGRRVTPPAAGVSPPSTGPRVGERRMINGAMGEWDGKGWKAVK